MTLEAFVKRFSNVITVLSSKIDAVSQSTDEKLSTIIAAQAEIIKDQRSIISKLESLSQDQRSIIAKLETLSQAAPAARQDLRAQAAAQAAQVTARKGA